MDSAKPGPEPKNTGYWHGVFIWSAKAKSIRSAKSAACEKKRESQIRSTRNKIVSGSAQGKANAKARKKKFMESKSKEEYNSSNKRQKRTKDNHEDE